MTTPILTIVNQRTRRRPLTVWELPDLLKPMHEYRRSKKPAKVDRKHFTPILSFVYRNRFVVCSQVQRRFSAFLRSDRTARRHLAEMESLGFLATVRTRSTSPLFPKVYFVAARGLGKLKRALARTNKPGDITRAERAVKRGYSADHVIHELLTTEFLLALWQTTEGHPEAELLTVQRRSLERHPAFRIVVVGRPTRLKPDAMFLVRQPGGMICCFLETDTGSMSSKQLETKFRGYAVWAESQEGGGYLMERYRQFGAADPKPAFRILVVTGDGSELRTGNRLAQVVKAAQGMSSSMRNRLWLTSMASLRKHQFEKRPLTRPIWRMPWAIGAMRDDKAALGWVLVGTTADRAGAD
jgi:hypothetical protein